MAALIGARCHALAILVVSACAISLQRSKVARKDLVIDDSAEELPVVLYGIESCDVAAYNLMVTSQLQTWGSKLPREHFVIVGGEHDDERDGVVGDSMPCGDAATFLSCKEATVLQRGVDRARQLDAQWLVVGQDDKYIWPEAVARALSQLNSSEPQVIASFGCGQGWEYHAESQNGTLPAPQGWVDPQKSCDAVWQRGAICGGVGYFVSRGALEILRREGEGLNEFVEKFVAPASSASDLAASCMFYDRGIPIKADAGTLGGMYTVEQRELENGVDTYLASFKDKHPNPLTMHLAVHKDDVNELISKLRPLYPEALLQELMHTIKHREGTRFTRESTEFELEVQLGRLQSEFMYAVHRHFSVKTGK